VAVTLKKILANTDEHVVIMMQEDTGNETDVVAMADIGGTNEVSLVLIEHVQYSLINDKSVDIQYSDNSSAHETQLELYGQGELGGISGAISDTSITTKSFVRVVFEADCKGTVIFRLRKVSGF
tara:strand:+ start:321 stop:692 length:372 start_codon:yes stop_codon:yes gene_type:complete